MTWILTSSGIEFDYANPQPHMIELADIANGLSHEPRFAGQTQVLYTVAQHSVLVSQHVPPEFALEALLHDAAEAYCKDIPSPLKELLPGYKSIERRVDAAIRERFGLPAEPSAIVKAVDLQMLATERQYLLPFWSTPWAMLDGVEPLPIEIHPYPYSSVAFREFVERWHQIQEDEQ